MLAEVSCTRWLKTTIAPAKMTNASITLANNLLNTLLNFMPLNRTQNPKIVGHHTLL
ncbi:hypothetical protein ENHAE0001_0411 [Enhydrobacter aerosaccus SK60]|nr:hypothetical protein ENHAE0001_0411 [Enhydrobacter aerosaccus SK60]